MNALAQPLRGGAKPRMLPASDDVLITIGRGRKRGIYEISQDRSNLARRVELPSDDDGASRGQIFFNPPPNLFSGPAVGIDIEIYKRYAESLVRRLTFFFYNPGYQLAHVKSITWEAFLASCKRVDTSPAFMPQMMVELKELR